jgi:hypothetical protein
MVCLTGESSLVIFSQNSIFGRKHAIPQTVYVIPTWRRLIENKEVSTLMFRRLMVRTIFLLALVACLAGGLVAFAHGSRGLAEGPWPAPSGISQGIAEGPWPALAVLPHSNCNPALPPTSNC